jgi:signal transduction histidine kinase
MFLVRWYRPVVQARTWKETAALLICLPLGIAWFTVLVTGLSVSAGMLITLVGIPLLVATVAFGRVIGSVERAKARAMLGAGDLPAFPKQRSRPGESWWKRAWRRIGDGPSWRGVAYGFIALPLGIAWFTVAITLWAVSLYGAAWFIYTPFIPDDSNGGPYHFGDNYVLTGWGRFGFGLGVTVIGLVLLALTPRIIHGIAAAERGIIRGLLSPSPDQLLAQRVEELTVSRDASVEGSSTELRRIERDLHDGAQQRLVALAMDLGMAKERLARDDDPSGAYELVGRAHDEAKLAIGELRSLVRGIHPQVLTDRGLDAALSALAARSTVPVTIDVNLPSRPPMPIESCAYFVVAESLANLSKHSAASKASVRVEQFGPSLLIDVRDDGQGGAVEHPGGGLSGLRDRVTAVEGTFRLSSPKGGPTVVHVELPCAS